MTTERGLARSRIAGLLTALAVSATSVAWFATPVRAASTITTTYTYTGATETFTVPDGVSSLTVTLTGGQGGIGGGDSQGSPTPGGYAGVVTGVVTVNPGDLLTVAVGGGGGTGVSSEGSAAGGSPGLNPLAGYDGAVGGVAGPAGSSGGGGGSGAASVLQINGVDIVAGGAGGNGGNGQFYPIVGRRAEDVHAARPDATSTTGRPGMNTADACTAGYRCDGGASGAGGGGAQGGERGAVQYGGDSATEYFGFGGFPGANSTGSFAGLTTNYDYYEGNSADGSIVISYDDGAPGAPTGLTGTTQNGAVALSWIAPATSGSSPISDYVVEYGTSSSGPFTVFADGTSTALSATVTGLTNGTAYYFRVSAVNDLGAGPGATTSVSVVPSDVPAAPTVTGLVPVGSGIYVDFTPGHTDSAITGYDYRLDGGTWLSGAVAANRLTIAGLSNGQTYSVEIRARNIIGAGAPSSPAQSATPRDVPSAPSALSALASNGSVALSWTAPATTNGAAVTDYIVQTATAADGPYATFVDGVSTATAATVTGLTNGTTYYLRVAAVNAAGTGASATPVGATPFTTPSAPVIDAVTPGDGTLTVDFTAGFNGGSAVTTYEYRIGSGAWLSTGSLATQFTISGLTNGAPYSVTIRALNAAGASAASSPASGTPRSVPAAPAIEAVALDTGAVSVSFTAGSDGGSPITNIEYSIDGGDHWITRSPASTASPMTITGLTGGQTYAVVLRTVNAAGPSPASNTSSVTAKGTPDAPTITNVTASDRALTVAFSTSANGGTPITNYELSTDGGSNWTTRSPASTSTPLVIGGLVNGTTYSIRIRAVNAVGSSPESAASAGTPRTTPGAPTIDADTLVGSDGALDIVFSPPASDGGSAIVSYQYSTDGGATWRDRPAGTTSSPLTITTLSTDGTTLLTGGLLYPVEIRAVNAAGPGVASAVTNGITTTVPGAPVITSITAQDSSAAVTFSAPANGGSAITGFEYRLDLGPWTDTGSLSDQFVVNDLSNSHQYSVEVRALNGVGNGPASVPQSIEVFTTPGAPQIDGVTAASHILSVDFTAGDDGGSALTTYEYSTDGGATWRIRTTGTTASPLVITTESGSSAPLTNGTVYALQLRAINVAGTGAASVSSLAAPRGTPDVPAAVTADPGDGQLTITFSAGSNGGSPITAIEYQLDGGDWVDSGSLSSPVTITGLTNGHEYSVALRARNVVGDSNASTPAVGAPRTVPGSPVAVDATGTAGAVVVSWSAPASDGGATVIGYIATLFTQPSGGSTVGQCGTATLTCTVTGLANGTTVYASVVAVNSAGSSVASTPRIAATPLAVPQVSIASITPAANALVVAVNVIDTGGAPILTYEYRLDSGSWLSASTSVSPFTIPGLTMGQQYSVEIRAVTIAGTGAPSPALDATPHTTPDAPAGLVATSGAAQVVLTWNAPPSDGGASITDYAVQYGTSVSGPFTTFADGTSPATGATVTGLTNGTAYYFRVAATNTAGNGSWSTVASATPLSPPSAPTITTITSGSHFLQVAFTAPSTDGGAAITGYEYQLDGGSWHAAAGTSTPITINGLTNGHTYAVVIRALNAVGAGSTSNTVSAKPYGLPNGVIGFIAAPGSGSVTLSWDVVNDNGSPITAYSIIRWSAASEGSILNTYTTTNTSYTVTGLSTGTQYFTIEATNAAGTGPRSAPRTTAIVGSTPPGAPAITSTVIDDTDAVVTWTAGSAGSSAITSYIVQYSTNDTTFVTMAAGSSATSASFELPSASTPYSLRVAAISAVGVGAFSTVRPPTAATGAVSAISGDGATIAGTVNANGGTVAIGFELATSLTDLGTVDASVITGSPASATGSTDTAASATLSGLQPGTTYVIRNVATAEGLTVRGSVQTFSTHASIVSSDLDQVYTGSPASFTTVTVPDGLDVARTFEGIGGTTYPLSATPPTDVGSYRVTTTSVDSLIPGEEVATLTIAPKQTTVTVEAVDRPYDGTAAVELLLGLDGAVDGDDVQVDTGHVSGSFSDPEAGIAKTVTITTEPDLLTGADAGNYAASIAGSVTASITRAAQTLSFTSSAPAHPTVGNSYTPLAVSSSGLTPEIAVTTGDGDTCTLAAGKVTFLAPGACAIVASQTGSSNFDAAADVTQQLAVEAAAADPVPTSDPPATNGFVPVVPQRVLDTRTTIKVLAGQTYALDVTPSWGLPAAADAVAINVTATRSEADGYLTTYPCDGPMPYVSTLNLEQGRDVANMVLVGAEAGGQVCIHSTASTDVVVDLTGYFSSDSADQLDALTPARVLDTRSSGKVGGGETIEVDVVGSGFAPAGSVAAVLNVTATLADQAGFLTVFPCGEAVPATSNVNYMPGRDVANHVTVGIGASGKVCIYSQSSTHVVVDLTGSFHAGANGRLMALMPWRLFDTRLDARFGTGTNAVGAARMAAGSTAEITVAGVGISPTNTVAVALNVTVTQAATAGFVTVYPCGQPRPNTSNVNAVPGRDVANNATIEVGADGKVCVYTSAEIHLVIDVNGLYVADPV